MCGKLMEDSKSGPEINGGWNSSERGIKKVAIYYNTTLLDPLQNSGQKRLKDDHKSKIWTFLGLDLLFCVSSLVHTPIVSVIHRDGHAGFHQNQKYIQP